MAIPGCDNILPKNQHYIEIEINELLTLDLNDLAVERTMLESLQTARSVREVYIVNGLIRNNIRRAIEGENTGTRIYKA